jgi:hypothetical protein
METKLTGSKLGTKVVLTYEEIILYSGEVLRSMNTLKYSYKSAQYSIRTIRLNNLQTSPNMTVYTKEMKNESNLRQSNVLNNIQECAVS